MNSKNNIPLVSIIVLTYNSVKYVLETLESIKGQTYKNIELIITDDSSSDATINLCRRWLEENSAHFTRTELITVEQNTGIPANCNRGVRASKGEWIKLIAGDDILSNSCIHDNISFTHIYPKSKLVLSDMTVFMQQDGKNIIINQCKKPIIKVDSLSSLEQYSILLWTFFENTPTWFISREVLNIIQFDEEIRHMEDYPFALKATEKGYKFSYLAQTTVCYRVHDSSITSLKKQKKIFGDYMRNKFFMEKYIFPNLSKREILFHQIERYRILLLSNLGLNKDLPVCKLINSITVRFSPIYHYKKNLIRR